MTDFFGTKFLSKLLWADDWYFTQIHPLIWMFKRFGCQKWFDQLFVTKSWWLHCTVTPSIEIENKHRISIRKQCLIEQSDPEHTVFSDIWWFGCNYMRDTNRIFSRQFSNPFSKSTIKLFNKRNRGHFFKYRVDDVHYQSKKILETPFMNPNFDLS